MLNLPTEYRDGTVSQKGVDLDTIQARSSARRALIIDDDPDTVDLIKIIFRNAGMDVVGAFSGKEAIQKCSDSVPSVILLDLMMPDMDGWETYDSIRQMTNAPVIVVSADTKKENVVRGLNTGFDDYVTKPFFPPELVARVNTVLRRAGSSQQVARRVYPEIDMTIDFESHEVNLRGEEVQLSSREFALLEVLAKKAPRLVRYEEIATKIWDKDNYKVRNRIKYLIYLLRQKIEIDPNDPQLVINREGLGYQLDTREKIMPVV
ncbi:MAG: response regulator transcription factor [Anaerolineales bacterium]|nr:response regulator transcription factor [Anaerolineales bacterium]